jgi:hypothetical protein
MVQGANAAVLERSIELGPGASSFRLENVGLGDQVILTLVNPTNTPLTFQTTERLGPEMAWVIPPNSSRTITYTHNQPFQRDVGFMVMGPTGVVVSQGVLIPSGTAVAPVSEIAPGTPVYVPVQTGVPVRGYW